jgi:hypothetical protein
MKMVPMRFYYQRARIFGWLVVIAIIAYVISQVVAYLN